MNISGPFIRRPVATVLLSVGLLMIAGTIAYFDLPVANLPNVDLPTLNVSASQPGARPRDHGGDGRRARWSGASARSPASPS